jgi:hypothetical protein
MKRRKYPSDISRRQFKAIEGEWVKVRKRTKPRTVDLYEVFCGLLYVLKSGCQWRMIPGEYPNWKIIYAYFCKWREADPETGISVLESVKKYVGEARRRLGKCERPRLCIVC